MLVLLVASAPLAAADLTVTYDQGSARNIYASGASSLNAPQNTTIYDVWGGYVIDWNPPAATPGLTVAGYDLYRIPGPGTPGDVEVSHLGARRSAAYDSAGPGTYIYFVTAVFATAGESIPGNPVSTADTGGNYPHCGVVGVFTSPPYYDTHIACLFPLP
ncbi:MAG TPA: hypothetical protein VM286_02530 [Candidatus Thermoplasmatota archaeon]|nr:hypothetical protein [Candidatus Thermoplasmatota archaeon]